MPLFETESLILKSYNLAEADRIVVFFTKEHGVVRGVAKGAKRMKSRFGSTLEPFSTVQLSYFQKDDRELVSIQHVELVRSCFDEAAEPEFLHTFSYIADLLLAFAPPHDPNETLYRMVRACLASASLGKSPLPSIRLYFEVWLLRLGGYLPDWNRCGECKRQIESESTAFLGPDFHLACKSCKRMRSLVEIGSDYRQVFSDVQRLPPADFVSSVETRPDLVRDLSDVMRKIISQVLGRQLPDGSVQYRDQAAGGNAI